MSRVVLIERPICALLLHSAISSNLSVFVDVVILGNNSVWVCR